MKTRAAVLRNMELPEPYATSMPLKIEDVVLAPPGEGEVLVEIACAGLCHSDLSVINGSRAWPVPLVLGHEAAGVVRELGSGVVGLEPGDHVVFSFLPPCGRCTTCVSGRGWLCDNGLKANRAGTLLTGAVRFADSAGHPLHHHLGVSAFSRHTVAAEQSLVKIDRDLPLERAALFGCAVMTGVGAVVNSAKIEPGQSAAIFGMGGVGLSMVMGAAAAGACPIVAADLLESKLAIARRVGATHTLCVKGLAPSDVGAAVRDMTRGGVNFAFDASGHPDAVLAAYESTCRGGTAITIGLPHPNKTVAISPAKMVADERTLKGCYMGSCVPRRDIPRFIAMHRAGRLPVEALQTHKIKLDDVNEGFDRLSRGDAVRQVVRMGE